MVVHTENTSGTVAWIVPTVGTIYIYQFVNTLPDSIYTTYDTITVIAMGLTRLGKTDVFETASRTDTALYHVETNNDISTADLNTPDPQWSLYPTGSHTTLFDPAVDSIRSDGTHIRVTSSRSFVGLESMNVLSSSYSTLHTTEVDSNIAERVRDTSYSITAITTDFWFIPQIGSFGKVRIAESDRSTSNSTGYTTLGTLIGYHPQ